MEQKPSSNSETTPPEQKTTYSYPSSGIREREGRIPLWLILVSVGLMVWGIYYMIAYWSPPE